MTLPYRDAALSVEERTADLLGRMTAEEKVAQLGSVWSFEIVGTGTFDAARIRARLPHGIGQITRLAGGTNLAARDVAELANQVQRHLVEETRLGIPAIVHEESLHGLMARGAPCFAQSIGAAASFDPGLVEEVATTIRHRMVATAARHALAPVLDIARDPRWGRIEETYGEDPFLAATMGVAAVRGLQGQELQTGVLATGKHMVGHGMAEGGLNQAPVHLGPREMRGEQLFPFEAAVVEAGLGSMMPAYCDVDGVACHASHELLTTILRDEWGFDGIVVSDYVGIEMLATQHRLTADVAVAAGLALDAGVDVELPRSVAFAGPLLEAIATGTVAEDLVDAAVARVLRAKLRLGLFEQPYVEVPTPAFLADLGADESRVAQRLAARSLVLVKNDGMLPLSPGLERVAVIGPIADSARDLLGDYSHLAHIETLIEMRDGDNALGFPITDEVVSADELSGIPAVLDALRERLPAASVTHARGCEIHGGTDDQLAEAVAVAAVSDVAIVVVGERSGLTFDATTGESRDRQDIALLGRQEELVKAVAATGTPVILVVISGRPLALERAAAVCAAVLLAWVPGDAGAGAIADALTGRADPGGKLPVTMLRHVGQVPLTYRHHPSGGRSNWKGDHVDGPVAPLWPFGFGLAYTTFEVSNLRVNSTTLATDGGEVLVEVDVANTGQRAGDEVVQLYFRDEEASVARPVIELVGFARVTLEPAERRVVAFSLAAEQFAYFGADGRRVIEPGAVRLMVGTSSASLPLDVTLQLTGDTVHLPARRRFLTPTTVT